MSKQSGAAAEDVAAAIIEMAGPVDPMKLQKLLYYAQAWHLAWYSQPLFDEEIEAWRQGPVVPRVYRMYKSYGFQRIPKPAAGSSGALGERERSALGAVLEAYAKYSASQLRELTHQEEPWFEVREGLDPSDSSDRPIPLAEMEAYYRDRGIFGGVPADIKPVDEAILDRIKDGEEEAVGDALYQAIGIRGRSAKADGGST
ncbi:MAG: type II toxin-antitoxin system antitoxin SocA domain-containing protein [Actinomycetota bacterium]